MLERGTGVYGVSEAESRLILNKTAKIEEGGNEK